MKKMTKLLSVLLVVSLLLSALPVGAMAAYIGEIVDAGETTAYADVLDLPEDEKAAPAEIISEIIEEREEAKKEYMMSDGTRLMVLYPDPVHYEESGEWEDIDNTLRIVESNGKRVLQNTAGDWDVSLPCSMDKNSPVTVEKDGYTLSFELQDQLTDKAVMMVTGDELQTVRQPEIADAAEEESAEIIDDDEVDMISAEPIDDSEIDAPEDTVMVADKEYLLEAVSTAEAEVLDTAIEIKEDDGIYAEAVLPNLNSAVEYTDVFDNVAVKYDLTSKELKESIVVSELPAGETGYRFAITAPNMELVLNDDNSVYAWAMDKKSTEPVFVLPAPYMFDAEGTVSVDVKVILENNGAETIHLCICHPTNGCPKLHVYGLS